MKRREDMEYGMVSVLIPKEYEKTFQKEAIYTMQDAANALQWKLYDGLCENLGKKIPLFNLLPCGSFPQYHKRLFVPSFSFDERGTNLGFCNIKFLRNYFKTAALKKALEQWCLSSGEEKTLFVYTIAQPLLAAIEKIKQKHKNLHICAIVADLPDMSDLSSKKSLAQKIFSSHKAKGSYLLLSVVDSFVLLTKYMAEYMHIDKPFCIVEGVSTSEESFSSPSYNNNIKTVFYAGTLHRKFGILKLVEAFKLIKSPDYRLVICGIGDSENEIKQAVKEDCRIKYYGQLPRGQVLKLQSSATVLVNPRQNNEEFTKYSFPSKNLEYLSSGIPFIAYKLDGIPDEYDEHTAYVADNEISSLSDKIIEICEKSGKERERIGIAAKRFANEQKNKYIQTKKIINLINSI